MKLWKSMKAGMKSQHGNIEWIKNKWYKIQGELEICKNGFHASENIVDAMNFVNCENLALVECLGKSVVESDKQCWTEMRVIKSWKWTKEMSVKLAIFSAELVIDIFEKKYPDEKRPREAIDAAKRYLKTAYADAAASADNAYNAAAAAASASADADTKNKIHNYVLKELLGYIE